MQRAEITEQMKRDREHRWEVIHQYLKQEARNKVQSAIACYLREGRIAEQQANLAAMAAEAEKARQQEQQYAALPLPAVFRFAPLLSQAKMLQCIYALRAQ